MVRNWIWTPWMTFPIKFLPDFLFPSLRATRFAHLALLDDVFVTTWRSVQILKVLIIPFSLILFSPPCSFFHFAYLNNVLTFSVCLTALKPKSAFCSALLVPTYLPTKLHGVTSQKVTSYLGLQLWECRIPKKESSYVTLMLVNHTGLAQVCSRLCKQLTWMMAAACV